MQYTNILKFFFLLVLYIILPSTNSISHEIYTIDKIAAIVDTDIILESDIQKYIKQLNIQHDNNYIIFETQKNKKLTSRNKILNQLISDTLILQLAKKINININNKETNEIIKYITTQNHMNNQAFQSYLTKYNINYNDYVQNIKKNTIINTIRNYEMHKRIKIIPYELNSLTETLMQNNNAEFQFDHILIPLEENPNNNQIKTAHSLGILLIEEIKKGTCIKKLEKLYEKNNQSQKIQITKNNWSTIEELPILFSENLAKQTLTKNSVIGPIRSNVGFHILKINNIEHNINKNITTIVYLKNITIESSDFYENQNIKNELLKIAERINNRETTFSIESQQISKKYNLLNENEELKWKFLDEFNPTIQTILLSLKKEEISPPVQTINGWSIIQLIDIKTVDKNKILYQEYAYQIIFDRKIEEEIKKWIQELKSKTYIKTFNS